jgi:glycosyltransferase involved in cell wall biosynthesis
MTPIPLPALAQPRITIVICNYNYGRFLERALRSALGQSYRCQVIVVDDGSTDDSRDILTRWQAAHTADDDPERIEVILQPNGGQISAYNKGFTHASGDVVVFLDTDDTLDANAAEVLSRSFVEGVAKVHYRMRLVDAKGTPLGGTIPNALADGEVFRRFASHGLLYPSAPGSGNAYRRTVLERLFPLPTDPYDRHGADFFAIYGAGVFGQVRAIEAPLATYCVHGSPTEAAKGLVFGNAPRSSDEQTIFKRRVALFRPWLAARTGGAVIVPEHFLDFSQEKVRYANAVLRPAYVAGVRDGLLAFPSLMRSLWLREDFSWTKRLGLTGWALALLVAPRPLGTPLARYVCNPATRRRATPGQPT